MYIILKCQNSFPQPMSSMKALVYLSITCATDTCTCRFLACNLYCRHVNRLFKIHTIYRYLQHTGNSFLKQFEKEFDRELFVLWVRPLQLMSSFTASGCFFRACCLRSCTRLSTVFLLLFCFIKNTELFTIFDFFHFSKFNLTIIFNNKLQYIILWFTWYSIIFSSKICHSPTKLPIEMLYTVALKNVVILLT